MRTAPVNRGWITMWSLVDTSITMSFARRQQRVIVAPATRLARARGVTSRSTSAWLTVTPSMIAPPTSASRSRAIVSVSGSSGNAAQLPPADVRPELATWKSHLLGRLAAAARGGLDVRGQTCHGEHTTARRPERFAVESGSGVEDQHVVRWSGEL